MSGMVEDRERAAVHPIDFWTDYSPAADGQIHPIDWVRWVKKGASGATTEDKVSRVQKHDPAIWAVVQPFYEHWKKGQDAPVDGTPIDAAPFITAGLAKTLKGMHIFSVEDFAAVEDSTLGRMNVPGVRALREKAKAFLDAQHNVSGVASELAALREQVALLMAEKAEIEQTADALAAEAGKPRRGRPPKVSVAMEA